MSVMLAQFTLLRPDVVAWRLDSEAQRQGTRCKTMHVMIVQFTSCPFIMFNNELFLILNYGNIILMQSSIRAKLITPMSDAIEYAIRALLERSE